MISCNKEEREWVGEVMSNFDHSIDINVSERLKASNSYADYPSLNFHGTVWFEDDLYHCQIKRYGAHIDTISKTEIKDIMDEACEMYGYE